MLMGLKYLDWRVKLYMELAHVYEELGSMETALKTIENCKNKVLEVSFII
jgi:hypothetical protein